eukprot:gene14286-17368_t
MLIPGSGSTRYRPQSQGIAHDLVHPHHPIPHLIRGIPMSIDQISLPKGVGPQAIKLLDAITGADTKEDLNRAGGKAEGFVLGLESAKAIKSQIAESLYVAYDDAARLIPKYRVRLYARGVSRSISLPISYTLDSLSG